MEKIGKSFPVNTRKLLTKSKTLKGPSGAVWVRQGHRGPSVAVGYGSDEFNTAELIQRIINYNASKGP